MRGFDADNGCHQLPSRPSAGRCGRTLLVLWGLLALGLLSGCSLAGLGRPDIPLNIDYRRYLPREWTPIGEWRPIDVDEDGQTEWLLFYAYDHGQIGGMVLDFQSNVDLVRQDPAREGAVPLVNQPAAVTVPYRLLPSYWAETGQGFIASPDLVDQIQVYSLTRARPEEKGGDVEEIRPDELMVRGGNRYISFFWWRGIVEGYGVAHVSAPGGVKPPEGWEAWDGITPPQVLLASYPENDRSLLCRKSTFVRQLRRSQFENAYRPAVYYQESARRLEFCQMPPPAQPFYPEAAVLAYLLGDPAASSLVPPDRRQVIAEVVGEYAWVYSLTYYDALLALSSEESDPGRRTMRVEAVLALDPAGAARRQVYFTLQHLIPLQDEPTSDRWQIVNAIALD